MQIPALGSLLTFGGTSHQRQGHDWVGGDCKGTPAQQSNGRRRKVWLNSSWVLLTTLYHQEPLDP